MAIRLKAMIRPPMEEVIIERLAPMAKRLDKTELVVEGLLPKIDRIDNNMDCMVRRMRVEDEEKARQTAMNGGGTPLGNNG